MAQAHGPPLSSMAALRLPLEEPAASGELGLDLGLGLKETVVATAPELWEQKWSQLSLQSLVPASGWP